MEESHEACGVQAMVLAHICQITCRATTQKGQQDVSDVSLNMINVGKQSQKNTYLDLCP